MKKVSKVILITLAALLGLAVLALLGMNLYIQSPHTQARIQEELGKALRLPLKIMNSSLTPWSDLRIHGITIPAEGGNFLEADAFNARYRFLPLLRGRLEISEMSVENPKIVWIQDAEGKWKLPSLEKAEAKAAEPQPAPVEKPRRKLEVTVKRFLVKNGSIEMLDHDNKSIGTFTEVFMDYTALTPERVEGVVTIGRAVWTDALTLENVRTPFSYANGEFNLPELKAVLAAGTVQGRFRAWPESAKSPFDTALSFEDVNLDQLAMQAGWKPGQASGRLGGSLELTGETARTERAEGRGQFWLRDGQLRQLDLLQTIGQVLGIRELSDFRLQDAHAEFRVGNEKVHVEKLILAAADLQLSAAGTIRFDQGVSLEAQLGVEDAVVKRLPDTIAKGFAKADNGRRTIDFNIGGTTSKLKTNLMDKLIAQQIDAQFGGLLDSFFKKKDDDKKKENDKKKRDEEKEKRKKEKEAQKNAAPPAPATPAPATPAPAAPVSAPPPATVPEPAPAPAPETPAPAAPPGPASGIPLAPGPKTSEPAAPATPAAPSGSATPAS